ncbi:hypothetical protein LCGC14_1349180 [marine sediment metagenome]|uniref:Uncharacterized protein n=1 Tax=marine sediment metagenome TaxID=412755 RepID=A0A0F9KXE7_9ZZZZ
MTQGTDDLTLRTLVKKLRSSKFVVPETLVGKGVEMAAVEIEKLINAREEDVANFIRNTERMLKE